MESSSKLPVFDPELQIGFYFRLKTIKEKYLASALKETVGQLDITKLDKELSQYVPKKYLTRFASFGLRGELFFPVPCLLIANPFLLGYYRLLFGFSKKEFYVKSFGKFKRLEEKGEVSDNTKRYLVSLCTSLIASGCLFLDELDADQITREIISELQLLTIGPQFRGSKNNEFGKLATQKTFRIIKELVEKYIHKLTETEIEIINDSGRKVFIQFASDPDIQIIEEISKNKQRGLISIEIKGGSDISNIHNRIGEAEKSHQKAKARGYFEFMTILRVDFDYAVLRKESPTTSHFFHLDKIGKEDSQEYQDFKDTLASIMSVNI